MRNTQQGFTLIELVVVIVILGILAATALPKFVDLSGEASQAAVDGVAGSISSASAINFSARKANAALGVAIDDTTNVCTNAIVGTLMQGGMPTGYTVSGTLACGANVVGSCVLTGKNSKVASPAPTIYCTN